MEQQSLARCIREPNGEKGLEGYQRGALYKFQRRPRDRSGRPYFRVWPCPGDYYETGSMETFKKYFEEVSNG